MDKILNEISNNRWDNALNLLPSYMESNSTDENAYVIGASIMEHYSQRENMYDLIIKGLQINPNNYELYLLLGNYYRTHNPNQALITYENALYHCISVNGHNHEDTRQLHQLYDNCIATYPSAPNVSIIIISFNTIEYTKMCIESIQETCYDKCYEIIVVDNASTDGSVEWLRSQPYITLIENTENVGFPAGCNQGIAASNPQNDIFLLNSDTLMTPNALYNLRISLYSNERNGMAGAVSNYAANNQMLESKCQTIDEHILFASKNNIPSLNPYELKSFLVMFATLIKRTALNKVGLLDERYTPGNYEDDDYGMRFLQQDYNCVLCWNCYIIHFGSKSFAKNPQKYKTLMYTNQLKFKEKWGFVPEYYTHPNHNIVNLIPSSHDEAIRVLEVGCGLGETLAKIRYLFPNASVHGIEIEKSIASIGSHRFDIQCGDIETFNLPDEAVYDYIIFGDVLEHLKNPDYVLNKIKTNIAPGGFIIASIPNLMNAGVIYELLAGNFTYQEAGILDNTHLRFFTINEITRMFQRTGYEIDDIDATIIPSETTEAHKVFFDQLLKIQGVADKALFDVYQYVIRAKVMSANKL